MPEGLKGKHTQICEELDQWRSWRAGSCVDCLAHHGNSSAPSNQDQQYCHFHTCPDKVGQTLLYCSHLCDKQADAKPKVKPVEIDDLKNLALFTSGKSLAANKLTGNDKSGESPLISTTSPTTAGESKAGIEAVDGREGGVRYREKLRKFVVEYRPSRFKWKLWMGTYSSQQDGRRAFDCAMFYAGQGKGNYYFPDSPHLFQKLGPLQRLFSQVSKDARDKSFNLELKKRAKEIIKQTAHLGNVERSFRCTPAQAYQHVDFANPELLIGAAPTHSGARSEGSSALPPPKRGEDAGSVAELACEISKEPKDCSDPTFKDLEPLFQLRPPFYRDDQVCNSTTATVAAGDRLSDAAGELRSGSPFFVPGLHTQLDTTPKFVLDSEIDEFRHDLPLWIYEIILSHSTSTGPCFSC
ncbi:hypothetical protein M758_5G006900 [Ceratodon purpureus]|uniref:AP2/ERF domain-containing protein n=1 Tax=Ceratodon purpureus TaxID=3225 RepID=A0A8T0HYP2_CERPU|nr:hypothetical protein KC19_5G006000 [Ceratodon purpureus]KAG0614996.1 hypothetical protein M758_5G006900 [Ceratodon purpureus]